MTPAAPTISPSACPPAEPTTDTDLLPHAAAGCPEAFTALFNRHYANIHAFAYRLCLCAAEAEDIAQETFIQAARSLGTFRREASFKNWLYTIASNRARDRLRQRQRRSRLDAALQAESPPDTPPPPPHANPQQHGQYRKARRPRAPHPPPTRRYPHRPRRPAARPPRGH